MFACALTTAGWMSALQSRLHELHMSERLRNEERIAHLAYHDPLTGLPNRSELQHRLQEAVQRKQPAILIGIDLDGFKLVNDSLGHAAGDDILCQLARRLEPIADGVGLIARQGGDEFALLTTTATDDPLAMARRLADAILAVIREPLEVDGTEFELDAGIGIALYPDHAATAQEVLRRADAAMYQAKQAGHGAVTVYSHEKSDARARLMLTSRLRRALANGELVVHYQPIFEPATGRIAMLEALARWDDPEHGLIPPGQFIPFSEETGLIVEIGDSIVDLITEQAIKWRAAGLEPQISFNVSPRQLREPDFAERLSARIAASGVPADSLIVEITESAMVDDPTRVEPVLHELAATGIRLAIDDFGADHSSLGRLRGLPVHILKVDRGLLRDVPGDHRGAAIVTSLQGLADALHLISVVEGVETEEQRIFLQEAGCPLAQGFHLGRPMPVDATTRLLEQDAVAHNIAAARPAAFTS
jgi:diguanylate cyclase (GGDEF)-like protein